METNWNYEKTVKSNRMSESLEFSSALSSHNGGNPLSLKVTEPVKIIKTNKVCCHLTTYRVKYELKSHLTNAFTLIA